MIHCLTTKYCLPVYAVALLALAGVRGAGPVAGSSSAQTAAPSAAGSILYSIGDPTPQEQLYLEFINRARADPAGEAELFRTTTDTDILSQYRAQEVDLNLMVSQFALLVPAPPVSLNAQLTAAARRHSRDMLANAFQGHNGTDGSTMGSRVTDAGYQWTLVGENVFSTARSVWHGHAAFDVDWGGDASTGGIQSPPGHRITIHNPDFSEVGIGVVAGVNGRTGPQVVTQDFARGRNTTPFVTGVAYYDLNGSGFYDIGEGIGGVTVRVSGSQYYAVTAASGGYSVPMPRDGTYAVTFALPGVTEVQKPAVIAQSRNVKVDFTPAYVPPIITGSDRPAVGENNFYQFSAVPGATAYQWKRARVVPVAATEGAEDGPNRVSIVSSAGYDVIDSSAKASGNFAFHLAHPDQADQVLTLNRVFAVRQDSHLNFSSRLGWAGSAQTAKAQVSGDGGLTWQDVWSQTGTNSRGEVAFVRQSIPLGAYAAKDVAIRFRYEVRAGIYFNQTDPGVGFYVDDIGISNADELLDEILTDASSTSFQFRPGLVASYSLRARAKLAGQFLPWGPSKLVAAQTGGPVQREVRIASIQVVSGQLQIQFDPAGATGVFRLERATEVIGPWRRDPAITPVQLSNGLSSFQFSVPSAPGGREFYRIARE